MISKTLHFFIALFLFSLNSYSQNPISLKDSLGIMNVMSLQQDAWNNGDIDSFMQGYLKSEELVFSGKSGPIYGWENTRKRYYSSYPNTQIMGKLNFTVKKIRLISLNSAYLIGEYYLKRSTEDSYGHFTLLWKKVDDNWLIVSDHTSAVK
ncbi:nuclear transport factor 2 family protein [Flavobacteriaceae bacterium]|jgi:ketosteroid isomerase-like protein|nr:nuclear transport factor 2 family protein [Flavobacteriaceae bacterium]MDB4093251.1 nuclear transport factor 2 family protein [Flavobacteriaceae bacterium]MDB9994746.1 nuclear transport factor 2 family protein [Flavobacteriaceae bacterium]MDC1456456.1 nuclear transport factor 2 family protein [Flavobacteriaceae bacterium]|tara:strand:+ start:1253 stop:1705 length:453 start_codon:yes stop_codon:yes gene_type:complete